MKRIITLLMILLLTTLVVAAVDQPVDVTGIELAWCQDLDIQDIAIEMEFECNYAFELVNLEKFQFHNADYENYYIGINYEMPKWLHSNSMNEITGIGLSRYSNLVDLTGRRIDEYY